VSGLEERVVDVVVIAQQDGDHRCTMRHSGAGHHRWHARVAALGQSSTPPGT
jgi:hypothetical protein